MLGALAVPGELQSSAWLSLWNLSWSLCQWMFQGLAHSNIPLRNNGFTGRSCQYIKNVRRTAFFIQTLAVSMDNELHAAGFLLGVGDKGELDFVVNGGL